MAKAMGGLDEAISKVGKNVVDVVNGKKLLHSNENIVAKAAYGAVNNGLGGAEVVNRMIKGQGVKESFLKTFANNGDKLFEDGVRTAEKANLNYGKIAGSYIGVATAARVVGGGGLYRDRNGNSNIVGVPFI